MTASNRHRSTKSQTKPAHKGLHPRNLHNQGYDFPTLVKSHPALARHVKPNAYGNLSIDFADPLAVKRLNAALLSWHYNIVGWDIPEGALCPPIPGRADYIHYVADLPGIGAEREQPGVKLLDIGTGANGIYPLLACQIYGWQCVGSDINPQSLDNVATIIAHNPQLKERFTLRMQHDKHQIFAGIIQAGEFFDVSVCNPPFHASLDEALKGNQLKLNNLARHRGEQNTDTRSPSLNFGGLGAELWCKGGEQLFLKKLIKESQVYATQCRWFTSLVSKAENVKPAKKLIAKLGAIDCREIEMKQGNKITRILAWTFM
ncbi:23S rRNA (adenine(1618)-N(6))-methyltransferase RlmF [Halomonas sp. TBZ9]|uniref:Ribosomal RNA large subunit methyltransferase F n=1 Tax=Vreelandella azerica TaxID=2732867 RepID=A0A7Y3TXX8_9GAMM|nr:23S rRNA (adenine(1618)-N(6))-methyltransferase RlmF [Halomonas azerica]NOG31507.1 23S rRNA (adenine(1618)-N(6))-methyltransferase RlmF [Halomonas azerica]